MSVYAVLAVLLWTALARGAVHGWPLAIAQLLTLLALGTWLAVMMRQRALEWRRTALDQPLALMFVLVLVQIALGNTALRAWALAPPTPGPEFTTDFPARFWLLGTVAPVHTLQALAIFAMHVAVYVLVVNVIRERRDLQRFIRTLLVFGAVLAFAALLDYMVGESWVLRWKEPQGEARLRGTFNNPDHFAAWLTMLVCLGVGALAGSRSSRHEARPLAQRLASREFREDLARRYLPFLGIVMASLGVVFTLSRGGIMSLFIGLGVMLLLFGRLGWIRWGLAVAGAFATVTLVYSSWIGLGPVLARLHVDQSRWLLLRATLPMLSAFPIFGAGLGTYGDIFFRYQTAALDPGLHYVSDAHNDFLQLVVETGPIGAAIAGFAAWRLVRDLVRAHLFGRGACPVGGGEGELAQRGDPFSIGVAVGALGALFAFGVHSLVDFPARIPANSVLAAACLGIATVALHTRFDRRAHLLVEHRSWSFGDRRVIPAAVGLGAVVIALVLVPWIVRPARIEAALAPREGTTEPARIEAALAIDPRDPGTLALRGERRIVAVREAPQLTIVQSAIADLRTALAAVPSDPFIHERLGWAYELLSTVDPPRASEHVASALAHLKRAIAMAPANAVLRHSLAALAATQPTPLLAIAFEASRAAVARDPNLLPHLVERFDRAGLADGQWVSVVPPAWPDRLELAQFLEIKGRVDAAETMYRAAIEVAPADERAVGVWMLAALLTRKGNPAAAAKELEQVLPNDPRNPELLLVYAEALDAQGRPAALDVYRAAVWQTATTAPDVRSSPLNSESPRIHSLIAERTGSGESGALRYRRALARYLAERRLWEQAGTAWDEILSLAPKDAEAHFFRAVAWEGVGMRDRAIAHYLEAVALSSQAQFRLPLARLLWDTDQYVQAMNEWQAVLASDPDNVEARLRLAQGRLKEGDRLAAYHEFKRLLKVVPDHPIARREVDRLTGAVR